MVRIRPSTRADDDVFLTESLVHATTPPAEGLFQDLGGLVLERSGAAIALASYGLGETRVSRGSMGWRVESDSSLASSRSLCVQQLKVARHSAVEQVIPIIRGIQDVALEQALEWISVVPKIPQTTDLIELQASLQRAEIAHPLSALLWEVGFVDLVVGHHLNFVWRNPAF